MHYNGPSKSAAQRQVIRLNPQPLPGQSQLPPFCPQKTGPTSVCHLRAALLLRRPRPSIHRLLLV